MAAWLGEYMWSASIAEDYKSKAPHFRAVGGKRKLLTPASYGPHLLRQMLKRRLGGAGLSDLLSPAPLQRDGRQRICSIRTCRWRTFNTWPGFPTQHDAGV